jgi:DeoR/GlpR family transcriptional regulator of sugar metabolism
VYLGLMIEHSARVIVVADQTKLGRVCFASLCQLDAVDALVIDAEPPLNLLQALRQADVRIIVA